MKYPYFPYGRVFCLNLPTPLEFQFGFTLSLKYLDFEGPHSVGMSDNLLCSGYGYFMEPHNAQSDYLKKTDDQIGHCVVPENIQ